MHFVRRAWSSVTPVTISNCFIKGGFRSPFNLQPEPESPIPDGMDRDLFTEFANFDFEFYTCGDLTDKEIVDEIRKEGELEVETMSTESEWTPAIPVPSQIEAKECLLKLRTFLENCDEQVDFDKLYSIELVVDRLAPKKKQASLDTFFSKLHL